CRLPRRAHLPAQIRQRPQAPGVRGVATPGRPPRRNRQACLRSLPQAPRVPDHLPVPPDRLTSRPPDRLTSRTPDRPTTRPPPFDTSPPSPHLQNPTFARR